MFVKYDQNNTRGTWQINDKLDQIVLIEANSIEDADSKANDIGIYFNGVEDGYDCNCCGDRWGAASKWDIIEFPYEYTRRDEDSLFLNSIKEYCEFYAKEWGYDLKVHYLDDKIETYLSENNFFIKREKK